MSDILIIKAKMHQIRFRLRLRPRPRWGAHSAPPDLLDGGEGSWILASQDPHPRSRSFGPIRWHVYELQSRQWCRNYLKWFCRVFKEFLVSDYLQFGYKKNSSSCAHALFAFNYYYYYYYYTVVDALSVIQ